ncbi:MAG: sigma-70 family RNA polymerase sigma factor [Candidatus Hydrogenedentes bacterium]|nr:sigma-70 family RNA polymerase sigma factor [Candidatus Hydrogenedentota bacterium]
MHRLVERARNGDLDAFGVLVNRYKDMAYAASYAILSNFHDAQDTAQEAFIQAWRKLDTLKDNQKFPGWLYQITRNLSLDQLRRARPESGSLDDVVETAADAGDRDPAHCAERRELQETVHEAVRSLSEANRLATSLFYINGYSIDEVAEFLEVPAGTVKRRLHDARVKLRERMADMVEKALKSNALPQGFTLETVMKIGDFACFKIIGYGPMGSVYIAEHPALKRNVAVKILTAASPEALERTAEEVLVYGKLGHPGFVKILSTGEHEGRPYVVTELLSGGSLLGWLDAHEPVSVWEILRIMVQAVDAVCYAHGRGIVIGCARPHQIMMSTTGDVVIVDAMFKISPEARKRLGRRLAPECRAKGQPGTAADIWDLGLLTYEMLTGKPLFSEDPKEVTRGGSRASRATDLRALKGRASTCVTAIVAKCLQEAPENRYSSSTELLEALREAQFAELAKLSDYDTERLLRDVDEDRLAAALDGAGKEIAKHLLGRLNKVAAERVRQERANKLANQDAARAARGAIVATADRLLREDRIRFSRVR